MSPIKNIAASILAAARMSEGHSTRPSSPDEVHREPSIGLAPPPTDGRGLDAEAVMLPNGDRLAYLADVVELQRAELTRLLQENRQLNERVDKMVRLQEREQVLRQQMHATLEHLSSSRPPLSLAQTHAGIEDNSDEAEQKYLALKQTVTHLVSHIQRLDPRDGPK